MAFRFRRSVKLGKGLRLNVSKRGVGVSMGTTGLRHSIHSTGSRTNTIGIPGTGLSYVDRSYGDKKSSISNAVPKNEQKQAENEWIVQQYDHYIHAITSMHQKVLESINWKEIYHTPAPFPEGEMGPLEREASLTYDQYNPSLLERIFKRLADKKQAELLGAIQEAKKDDEATYRKWQQLTELASDVLNGESGAYERVIKNSDKFNDMRDRSVLHVINPDTVEMDVHVEPRDIIPKKKVQLTKTGKVSKRKMNKSSYYRIVNEFVCSHALWTARCLFASLPVETCVVHMTETAINTATGHYEQRVLLSVLFDRRTMNQLNMALVNPLDAIGNFQHHVDFRVTKGFRAVNRMTIQ